MPEILIRHGIVTVSQEDEGFIKGRSWHVSQSGYAKTYSGTPGGTPLRMHRLILERKLGRPLLRTELVDHVNGCKLDNRRTNLRIANKSQNSMNRSSIADTASKFVGVCLPKGRRSWMTYINVNGRRFGIGHFKSESEAAWMYDQWAIELHGDYARLNFEYKPITGRLEPKEKQE